MLTANSFLPTGVARSQSTEKFSFQLTSNDAIPDSTLPIQVRSFFEDADESPLECASVDLNGDGTREKFVPNKFLEGNGLCPWLILDSDARQVIGRIDAKVIFVLKSKHRGHAILEGYQKSGGSLGHVRYYRFDGGEYKDVGVLELKDEQIDKYFKERKNVPHPRQR